MKRDSFLPFSKPTIRQVEIDEVVDSLRSGWITSGPCVKQLEQELSQYFGGRTVRAMRSASGALEIALGVAGVCPGCESLGDLGRGAGDGEPPAAAFDRVFEVAAHLLQVGQHAERLREVGGRENHKE